MSIAARVAQNTLVQIAGKVLSTVLGVLIVGLLTRYLGQVGFGAYSTANAFLQIFGLLLDLGMNVTFTALLGEHADDPAFQKRCVSALYTLRILVCILVFGIVSPLITVLMPYPLEVKLAILALSGSVLFPSINQIVIGVEQRHLAMLANTLTENLSRLIVLFGVLLAQKFHWGIIPIALFISFAALVQFLVNQRYARRFSNFSWNIDPAFWKMAFSRSWPVGISIVLNVVYYKADTVILSLYRSQAEVGVYGAAYRVLEILITIPFLLAGVLLPLMAHAWAKQEHEKLGQMISSGVDAMLLLVLPMIAGVALFGQEIMTLIAGPEFRPAGYIIKILMFAVGAIYLNTIFTHAIIALKAQKKMIPLYVTVAFLTLLAYLIYIPRYGFTAAALLTVVSEVSVVTASWLVVRSHVAIPWHKRTLFGGIVSTAIMTVIGYLLLQTSLPAVLSMIIAGLSYATLLVLTRTLTPDTAKILLQKSSSD